MGDATIKFYYSSIISNQSLRKQQQHIEDVLTSQKIDFEKIDITSPDKEAEKLFMREHSDPPENGKIPLPPQLFLGEEYLGGYEKFENALECGELEVFLKRATKTEESEAEGKSND